MSYSVDQPRTANMRPAERTFYWEVGLRAYLWAQDTDRPLTDEDILALIPEVAA